MHFRPGGNQTELGTLAAPRPQPNIFADRYDRTNFKSNLALLPVHCGKYPNPRNAMQKLPPQDPGQPDVQTGPVFWGAFPPA